MTGRARVESTRVITRLDLPFDDDDEEVRGDERTAALIVMAGGHFGRMFPLDGDTMILGRGYDTDIMLADDGISRQHCRIIRDRAEVYVLEDLRSTNGTWVNRARVHQCELKSGDRIRIGSNTLVRFVLQTPDDETHYRSLYNAAIRDSLTGVFNKRYLFERLESELSFLRRQGGPLSLILLDLDDFKSINGTVGHAGGDRVLEQIGALLLEHTRLEDVVARFGGDEFAVVARSTSGQSAQELADRLRRTIRGAVLDVDGQLIRVTVSLGIATAQSAPYPDAQALFKTADRAMLDAKSNGKDRVFKGPA